MYILLYFTYYRCMIYNQLTCFQEKKSNLEEVLRNAALASQAAPTNTMKRRIRQRLHKKLGCVLSKKERRLAPFKSFLRGLCCGHGAF